MPTINRGAGLPRLSRLYQFRWQALWKRDRPGSPPPVRLLAA